MEELAFFFFNLSICFLCLRPFLCCSHSCAPLRIWFPHACNNATPTCHHKREVSHTGYILFFSIYWNNEDQIIKKTMKRNLDHRLLCNKILSTNHITRNPDSDLQCILKFKYKSAANRILTSQICWFHKSLEIRASLLVLNGARLHIKGSNSWSNKKVFTRSTQGWTTATDQESLEVSAN